MCTVLPCLLRPSRVRCSLSKLLVNELESFVRLVILALHLLSDLRIIQCMREQRLWTQSQVQSTSAWMLNINRLLEIGMLDSRLNAINIIEA